MTNPITPAEYWAEVRSLAADAPREAADRRSLRLHIPAEILPAWREYLWSEEAEDAIGEWIDEQDELGESEVFTIAEALHWFATDSHVGQWCPLYGVLSLSTFRPGMMDRGPSDDAEGLRSAIQSAVESAEANEAGGRS